MNAHSTPMSRPALSQSSTATALDRALPAGFAIALTIWLVAFIARIPSVALSPQWLLALLVTALAGGTALVGWQTRSLRIAVLASAVAGLVNCLLVSSVIHSAAQPTLETPLPRADVQAWLWIPGNFFATLIVGFVFGFIGTRGPRSTTPAPSLGQSQASLAWVIVVSTLALIAIGGLVTSMDVGLAVPDWPTSYGYNMFLFPFTKMVGGIFYEHAHRLIGSLVGLETLILCAWLWLSWRRTGATAIARMGTLALVLVIVQGLLGAFRVIIVNRLGHETALAFAVVHALTAQLFLLSIIWLAIRLPQRTSAPPQPASWLPAQSPAASTLRNLARLSVVLILAQTVLGALTRHFHFDWALLAHLLGAIAIAFLTLSLLTLLLIHAHHRPAHRLAFALMFTLALQLILGGVAWWVTSRMDEIDQALSPAATAVTAGHVVTGALMLALCWTAWLSLGARHEPIEHTANLASATQPRLTAIKSSHA